MKDYPVSTYNTFYAIGLNYLKADAETRGRFNIDKYTKEKLIQAAKKQGLEEFIIISTCNRTEIYSFANKKDVLVDLLCSFTQGSKEEFEEVCFCHENKDAISHIFRVGTGLDSQILGDFEIIGQLKSGFLLSKKHGMVNAFLERLINAVIQSSKRIKNETEISSGATSVSFASVRYILNHIADISEKNILLFGTGKIGRNTCENLVKHTKNKHITLINRTKDKAEKIAGKFNLRVKNYADLQTEIRNSDVLIVATGAQTPTITKELIYCDKELLILDLSIPKNVANDVKLLENVTLVHLDHLSKITDSTLEKRKRFIPEAKAIIAEVRADFDEWLETRKYAATLVALKKKFKTIQSAQLEQQNKKTKDFDWEQTEIVSDRILKKIMNYVGGHLRQANGTTEQSLDLLKEVFQLEKTEE